MQLGHHGRHAVPHQDTILVEEGGDRTGDGGLPLLLRSTVHVADRQGVLVIESVGKREGEGQRSGLFSSEDVNGSQGMT